MKEFICVLKQTNKVTKYNFWCLMINLFAGAVWGVMFTWLPYFSSGVLISMEGIVALGFVAVNMCMCWFLFFPADYMQALAMGKTRKYLFGAHYLLWFRNALICMLGILGICLIKDYVYSNLVDGLVVLRNEWSVISNPLVFVTIVLCVPALILFLGGMRLFFGVKLLWGIPGLFVLAMGLTKLEEKCPDFVIFRWFGVSGGESNTVAICLLCLISGAIMMGLAWMMLRKQRVVG